MRFISLNGANLTPDMANMGESVHVEGIINQVEQASQSGELVILRDFTWSSEGVTPLPISLENNGTDWIGYYKNYSGSYFMRIAYGDDVRLEQAM